MPADLFTPAELAFMQSVAQRLKTMTPEQQEAAQVVFFGLPELPDHLAESEALLAWQERLGCLQKRMSANGYGTECDRVLSGHGWALHSVAACRSAYEELKAEVLRLTGGKPTQAQLEEVSARLDYFGCGSLHDRLALLAYMLDLPKPTPASSLPSGRLQDFLSETEQLMPEERSACLFEARQKFGVLTHD